MAVPIAFKVIKEYSDKLDDIYVYCYGKNNTTYNIYLKICKKCKKIKMSVKTTDIFLFFI